jgi:ribosomal protein S6--L-glutamate ligase
MLAGKVRESSDKTRRKSVTRIGIFTAYPDDDWHSRRIVEAARAHGEVDLLSATDLTAEIDRDGCRMRVRAEDWSRWDLFLTPRAIGEEGDGELQLELYGALADAGALLVNDVRALVIAIDKFRSSWRLRRAGLPTPRTFVAQTLDEAERVLAELGQAIVKPNYGSLGIGIARVRQGERARLAALLERNRALYLQELVEAADVRAFVVGPRVAAAMVREGEHAREFALPLDAQRLAVRAARTLGLDYAGVDLMIAGRGAATVIEVNGTPHFEKVERATGRDMARALVAYAVERAAQRRRREGSAWEPTAESPRAT